MLLQGSGGLASLVTPQLLNNCMTYEKFHFEVTVADTLNCLVFFLQKTQLLVKNRLGSD